VQEIFLEYSDVIVKHIIYPFKEHIAVILDNSPSTPALGTNYTLFWQRII
jgi:hypothetical protein